MLPTGSGLLGPSVSGLRRERAPRLTSKGRVGNLDGEYTRIWGQVEEMMPPDRRLQAEKDSKGPSLARK